MSPKRYLSEVAHQAKKVRWPKFNVYMKTLGIVLVVIFIAAVILMLEDLLSAELVNAIDDVFGA